MPRVTKLAERLTELRVSGRPGGKLTQRKLSKALGVSVPLISSWEHGTEPPEERLDAYARLFAHRDPGAGLEVPDLGDLTDQQMTAYRSLRDELMRLRGAAAGRTEDAADHPLRFPAGQPITVVCSELPERLRSRLGYAGSQDPDYIASYRYADLDALIELLPFVQVLNPASSIKHGTVNELSIEDLSNHLIALGGVDFNPVTADALTGLTAVPVSQMHRETEDDLGGFSVHTGTERIDYSPLLRPDGDSSVLVEDVAHFFRSPNPYNRERTLTSFSGMYSRGSQGVVQALTDPNFQERNASYIAQRFGHVETYSIVCRVMIVAGKAAVPDWTLKAIRLHEWPEVDQ